MSRARALVAAVLCAACGKAGEQGALGTAGSGGGESTQASSAAPARIADGSLLGFVRAIRTGASGATLTIDAATMLTGEDASRAAAEDGETELPVPNDYYIDDDDHATIDLPVASSAMFAVQGEDGQGGDPGDVHRVDVTRFVALFGASPSYFATIPYRVSVEGGVVTAVEQVYLP